MELTQNNGLSREGKLAELRASLESYKLVILPMLPNDLDPKEVGFVEGYIEAQLNITQGNLKMAGDIFGSLDEEPEFEVFEKSNQPIFAAIDIAIRGTSNRKNRRDEPVEPLFTINKN